MQNKTLSIAAAAVAVVATTAIVAGATYAYQGKTGDTNNDSRPFGERHAEMFNDAAETALQNNDYTAWLNAIGSSNPMAQYITADNFTKFAEMHQAMKDGDFEKANSLRTELNIPNMPQMHGRGMKMGWGMMEGVGGLNKTADVKAAIEAGDYSAFKTAVEAHSPLSYITADNFAEYVDAYKASEGKDFSKMKDFMQKYGPAQPTQK
jgi:hypothetical protein